MAAGFSSLVLGPSGGMKKDGSSESTTLTRFGKGLAGEAATRAAGAVSTAGVMGIAALEKLTGVRFDPAPAYLFYVELGGLIVAAFTECGGLEMEREVEELAEGGVNDYTHKFPGRSSYSNLTLKRGLSVNRTLWSWYREGIYNARVLKLNFSIILGAPMQAPVPNVIDYGFAKVKHWNIESAWPVKWVGPDLDTSSSSTAIEEIEIAHHGLDLSFEVSTPINPVALGMSQIPGF